MKEETNIEILKNAQSGKIVNVEAVLNKMNFEGGQEVMETAYHRLDVKDRLIYKADNMAYRYLYPTI